MVLLLKALSSTTYLNETTTRDHLGILDLFCMVLFPEPLTSTYLNETAMMEETNQTP